MAGYKCGRGGAKERVGNSSSGKPLKAAGGIAKKGGDGMGGNAGRKAPPKGKMPKAMKAGSY